MMIKQCYDQLLEKCKAAASLEDSGAAASVLFEEVFGVDRFHLHLSALQNQEVDMKSYRRLIDMAERYTSGEPLQYICGHWGFYGLDFMVQEGVLIPRADTEVLVDAALEAMPHHAIVYDLCAGSGCIGISLGVHGQNVQVYAVEKSKTAFEVLKLNRSRYDVDVIPILDDVLCLSAELPTADVIVSNPPYLDAVEMQSLQGEVRYEPKMALFGGEDGLQFYNAIPRLYWNHLQTGGWLLFEVGYTQSDAVSQILSDIGYVNVSCRKDFGGNTRVVMAQKPH